MVARYRNITTKPPRYFVPPKPPRFRVTVNQEEGRWVARLMEGICWRVAEDLQAMGKMPIAALYELDTKLDTDRRVMLHLHTSQAWLEAKQAVSDAIFEEHKAEGRRKADIVRRWSRQWKPVAVAQEAVERAILGGEGGVGEK